MGLYSGGGAYIWNEVSVSTCGGLIVGGLRYVLGGLIVGGLRYILLVYQIQIGCACFIILTCKL